MKIREMIDHCDYLKGLNVIDAHAHLGMTKFFYIPGNPDISGLIGAMDRVGIKQIVIAPNIAITCDYISGNQLVLEAAQQFSDRVVALATANLHYDSENLNELERCFKNDAFKGIKLHPDFMEYSVQDKQLFNVLEFAAKHKAFILSHTDARINSNHPIKFSDPVWFEPYIKEFPQVDFILAHCGLTPGAFEDALRLSQKYDNVFLDTTGFRFSNTWTVEEIVKGGCANKLIFASDMPFNDVGSALGRVIYADISEEDKLKILGGNMQVILNK